MKITPRLGLVLACAWGGPPLLQLVTPPNGKLTAIEAWFHVPPLRASIGPRTILLR